MGVTLASLFGGSVDERFVNPLLTNCSFCNIPMKFPLKCATVSTGTFWSINCDVDKLNKTNVWTIRGFYSSLTPSTFFVWTKDPLYQGERDRRLNTLKQSITECQWNPLGALFKCTCDYRGKMPVFMQAVSGPFLCRGLVTFQLWPVWTHIDRCSQAAPHCPISNLGAFSYSWQTL